MIGQEGPELQRGLLQATFALERRARSGSRQSPAPRGFPTGGVEARDEPGPHQRVPTVPGHRCASRKRHASRDLYHPDARQVLPNDPSTLGIRPLTASHWPTKGAGRRRRIIREPDPSHDQPRPGWPAQPETSPPLDGMVSVPEARATTPEKRASRTVTWSSSRPNGQGIALAPAHRKKRGREDASAPGSRRWPRSSPSPTHPRRPRAEDIAAPQARRKAHPGPEARVTWAPASITESIDDMIAAAYDEATAATPDGSASGSSSSTGTSSRSPPSRPGRCNAASKCRS